LQYAEPLLCFKGGRRGSTVWRQLTLLPRANRLILADMNEAAAAGVYQYTYVRAARTRKPDLCPSVENRVAQMPARPSPLRKRFATPCLGLDCTEQVLPRFIEGLGTLRLQVGRQLFEINSRFSKIVQNSFAVSSVSRKSSGQFAMISKGQKSLLRYGVDRVWRGKSGNIKNVRSL